MRIALFSQSLFALPLEEAIDATARLGFPAIELACIAPHLDLATPRPAVEDVARRIRAAGLRVSALSGFNSLTDAQRLPGELDAALTCLDLAALFDTALVKLTPGGPASATAADAAWDTLQHALDVLVPRARALGLRLAFETHMRQLTDTLASSQRFLALAPIDVVGLTLDVSNLAFAGEDLAVALPALAPRTLNTHIKNGYIDAQGGWHFGPLNEGLTDYARALPLLAASGYHGYLTLECLGPAAADQPLVTARRDLDLLRLTLQQLDLKEDRA